MQEKIHNIQNFPQSDSTKRYFHSPPEGWELMFQLSIKNNPNETACSRQLQPVSAIYLSSVSCWQ